MKKQVLVEMLLGWCLHACFYRSVIYDSRVLWWFLHSILSLVTLEGMIYIAETLRLNALKHPFSRLLQSLKQIEYLSTPSLWARSNLPHQLRKGSVGFSRDKAFSTMLLLFYFPIKLYFTLGFVDPLYWPAPIGTGDSYSRAHIVLFHRTLFPNLETLVDACRGNKSAAWGEAHTRYVVLVCINGSLASTLEIVHSHLVRVWSYCYPRRVGCWTVDTPSRVICARINNVRVFEGVLVEVMQIYHANLTGHVHRDQEFLVIASYDLQVVYFFLHKFFKSPYPIIVERNALWLCVIAYRDSNRIEFEQLELRIHCDNQEAMPLADNHKVHFLSSLVITAYPILHFFKLC